MFLCRFAEPSIAMPTLSVFTLSDSDLLYIAVTVPPGPPSTVMWRHQRRMMAILGMSSPLAETLKMQTLGMLSELN